MFLVVEGQGSYRCSLNPALISPILVTSFFGSELWNIVKKTFASPLLKQGGEGNNKKKNKKGEAFCVRRSVIWKLSTFLLDSLSPCLPSTEKRNIN